MARQPWAADCRVSLPRPLPDSDEERVSMFGFVFTSNGLFHDLSVADHEEVSTPTFAPTHDPGDRTVFMDGQDR